MPNTSTHEQKTNHDVERLEKKTGERFHHQGWGDVVDQNGTWISIPQNHEEKFFGRQSLRDFDPRCDDQYIGSTACLGQDKPKKLGFH